jgi:mannose/fructose-specific phosphotransferase system component IIA
MVSILVITEKTISATFQSVAEELIGEKTGINFIGIDKDMDVDSSIDSALKKHSSKDGVLALTENYGTKHANHLLKLAKSDENIEVLSGINIPMLIAASKYSIKAETSLLNLVSNVKRDALKSILTSADFFGSFDKN